MKRHRRYWATCLLGSMLAACGAAWTAPRQEEEEARLPGGKMQKEELLRRDYEDNLKDAARLADLALSLKAELEQADYRVFSVKALKTVEEIERVARRIRNRMRR